MTIGRWTFEHAKWQMNGKFPIPRELQSRPEVIDERTAASFCSGISNQRKDGRTVFAPLRLSTLAYIVRSRADLPLKEKFPFNGIFKFHALPQVALLSRLTGSSIRTVFLLEARQESGQSEALDYLLVSETIDLDVLQYTLEALILSNWSNITQHSAAHPSSSIKLTALCNCSFELKLLELKPGLFACSRLLVPAGPVGQALASQEEVLAIAQEIPHRVREWFFKRTQCWATLSELERQARIVRLAIKHTQDRTRWMRSLRMRFSRS